MPLIHFLNGRTFATKFQTFCIPSKSSGQSQNVFFHICVAHMSPVLMTPVRIESPEQEFSKGCGFLKIGTILGKIWANYCQ